MSTPLQVCDRCGGFVARAASGCSHCRRGSRAIRAGVLALGATLAVAIYVPGCAYGCPPGSCGDPIVDAPSADATGLDGGDSDAAAPDAAPAAAAPAPADHP